MSVSAATLQEAFDGLKPSEVDKSNAIRALTRHGFPTDDHTISVYLAVKSFKDRICFDDITKALGKIKTVEEDYLLKKMILTSNPDFQA
jgi:hypothetical protein